MRHLRPFRRDQNGVSALEFALLAPVLLSMLVGITQLGGLFFARADLRHAVAAGAREAQIFPRPTNAAITEKIQSKMHRLETAKITGPSVTVGRDANGFDFADIQVSYAVPVNFIIYKPPPINLVERRRVYLSPTAS